MQTAANALSASNAALTGLTYIDTLVSGATAQGLTSIVVDGKYLNPTSIASLESDGYVVTQRIVDYSPHTSYFISWGG